MKYDKKKWIRFSGMLLLVLSFAGSVVAQSSLPYRLPRGYAPAPGTIADADTGLPTRIVHQSSGISLRLIPAGEFMMGSPTTEANRMDSEDLHRRVIRQPFYLGETEVTVAQFRRFVTAKNYQTDAERGTPLDVHRVGSFAAVASGDRAWSLVANWRNAFPHLPEYRSREDHPVIHVSWNDAQQFCAHFGMQLPTEAQWEYAARAGTKTSYFWGDQVEDGARFANVSDVDGQRRFKNWGPGFPFSDGAVLITKVGRYRPNAWGLYDMIGNVLEWVADAYVGCYPGDGADESAVNGDGKTGRVLRGGSWLDSPMHTRSAARVTMVEAARRDFIGFRVALNLTATQERK